MLPKRLKVAIYPTGTGSSFAMNKWIVILLLLGVGGFFGYKKFPEWKASKTAAERNGRIPTAKAERKDIRFNVKAA